ncbi:unnamed protein product [Porites evermanni]|uniref:Uncharacterized protein n=1 Tax=Porites evermanni TaxID=104178 RepID=A0ABN8M048_9CNID|nr:unnamed protein product [Porites evermanni]
MILVLLDKELHTDNKSLIPLAKALPEVDTLELVPSTPSPIAGSYCSSTSVEVDASDRGMKKHKRSMKARGQRSWSVKGTSHKVISKDKRKVSRLMDRLYNESREEPRSEDQGTLRDMKELHYSSE